MVKAVGRPRFNLGNDDVASKRRVNIAAKQITDVEPGLSAVPHDLPYLCVVLLNVRTKPISTFVTGNDAKMVKAIDRPRFNLGNDDVLPLGRMVRLPVEQITDLEPGLSAFPHDYTLRK